MTTKRKSPAPNGASTKDNQNQCLIENNTGLVAPQQKSNLERYAGPALHPGMLAELRVHIRALEQANRAWRAAGNSLVDFKRVRGKWIAYEDPTLKTMGELIEREGRRALRFWEGKAVPKFQPWSEWSWPMTDEVNDPVLNWRKGSPEWTALTRAIQRVKCELRLICGFEEYHKPGSERRITVKMNQMLNASRRGEGHV
jgi:hypothetical protein